MRHVVLVLPPAVDRAGKAWELMDPRAVIVCADHGDCWGEDGLWEHGVSHEKTLEVPLLFRLAPNAPSSS